MTSSKSQPGTLIADGLLNGRDPEIAKAIMEPNGKQYRKTALVWAFPLSEEVTVNTPEGHMQAHIGDYLVSDKSLTHLWPVRRDVFEATHVEAEAAQNSRPPSQWRYTPEAERRVAEAIASVVERRGEEWFDGMRYRGEYLALAAALLEEMERRLAAEEPHD